MLSLIEQSQDYSFGFLYCLLQADSGSPQIPPAPEKAMQSSFIAAILRRNSHRKYSSPFYVGSITSSTDYNWHPFPAPSFFQEHGNLITTLKKVLQAYHLDRKLMQISYGTEHLIQRIRCPEWDLALLTSNYYYIIIPVQERKILQWVSSFIGTTCTGAWWCSHHWTFSSYDQTAS